MSSIWFKMKGAVVFLFLLHISVDHHVFGQGTVSTTTSTTPGQAGFKFSSGKSKVTAIQEKVPPTKAKLAKTATGVDMLPGLMPAKPPSLRPPGTHLKHESRVPISVQKLANQAISGTDMLVLPPISGTKSHSNTQSNIPKAPKNFGFIGVIPDSLVLSETPHISSSQPFGFADIFHPEPVTQLNHSHVAKTELVRASAVFDRRTKQLSALGHNSGSRFQYPGQPVTANPLVSFISIDHPQNARGFGRRFRYKNAILLSSHPPLYPRKKHIKYNSWVDLNRYRKRAYNKHYSVGRFHMASSGKYMTLLEAGSVANFEDQFKHFIGSSKHSKLPSRRPVSVLEEVLSEMDLNADPCEDFYQFACGGFIANSTRTNGITSKLDEAKENVLKTVTWVLEQKTSKMDPEALVKGKQFYKSCMDENAIEMRGLTPVRNFLSDRGGWPVLGLWDPRRFNVADMLARSRSLQKDFSTHFLPTGTIIGMTVQRDFARQDKHAIYLDQPSLGQLNLGGMPNNEVYKLGKGIIYNKAYEDYLVDVAVALGANPKVARQDMCDVMNFERALADIMLPEEERRLVERRYKLVSILEMSLRYPYFDWFHFIQHVLGHSNISVRLSDKVVVWATPYFDRLGKVLSKTPKRVLANYVLFRAIQPMLPATNRLMQHVNLRYKAVANGAKQPHLPRRSEFCAGIVIENMDWLASRIYIESRLGNDVLDQVAAIQSIVKQTLASLIENASWLDIRTKQAHILKLEAMKDRLGLPVKLLDDKLINDYYRDFNITENFFENMETVLRQNYVKLLHKLIVTPVNDWIVRPSELRTLYNSGTNAIEIPAAFFQKPFTDMRYSPAMNYGGIGTLIARAYAQAFDISGMKFDWNGVINNIWSNQATYRYKVRANCLVNQYSNFYLPDADLLIVNGNKTLNGNLQDNMAVKTGYHAYQAWKSTNQIQQQFELPFTGEQLYFINYARGMCHNASPTYTRKLPYSSLNSVPRLRVIGPLQNSWEFSSAFQCPLGTPMNPRNKCYIW